MQDGPLRGAVKRFVRALWTFEMVARRRLRIAVGRERWVLGGACRSCARCCDTPTVRVGAIVWHLPTPRRIFLWWQRAVNGFDLVRADRAARTFVFRCGHLLAESRRCDSYATRPFMCRDYPRLLLEAPWPDLFEECGHHAVARNAAGVREALARTHLPAERQADLAKKLHLGEQVDRGGPGSQISS
jgi:uncharacterized protein